MENQDINNVVSATVTEGIYGAKAGIALPQTGKKISGNRIIVMVEAYKNPDNVSEVLFEYKPSYTEKWEKDTTYSSNAFQF